ncbi:MAG: iron-containing alcohol dehydrogenase [Proteobacteria bacterium]|nr:iron-containing alcohol dehydrogenase [Pseudomonadota bacterium]
MECEYQFATATRILFGKGNAGAVAAEAEGMGRRALLVTGWNGDRAKPLVAQLGEKKITSLPFQVSGEPTVTLVKDGVKKARRADCDLVIAMGGGSALDAGKAIAALLTNRGEIEDYLEVIGRGMKLKKRSAPFIAIPTTAGTGSEVTRNAVVGSPEHRVKVSMRSPLMQPSLAVVDPSLTVSMPPMITACTGLDALTQLIEAYVSCEANPDMDAVCREGVQKAARSLRIAYENGDEMAAREDMCVASLFGGLALANAKLGAVHGLAGPVGGMFSAPHGTVCARLLPHVMEANVNALQSRAPDLPYLSRYDELAKIVTGNAAATAADGVVWVKDTCAALRVPALADFGLTENDFPEIVEKAKKASSMRGNPIFLTDQELTAILQLSKN